MNIYTDSIYIIHGQIYHHQLPMLAVCPAPAQ